MGKIIRAIDEWGVVRVTFADTTDIAEKACCDSGIGQNLVYGSYYGQPVKITRQQRNSAYKG